MHQSFKKLVDLLGKDEDYIVDIRNESKGYTLPGAKVQYGYITHGLLGLPSIPLRDVKVLDVTEYSIWFEYNRIEYSLQVMEKVLIENAFV